nr:hypothetical protein [Enterococcus sp. 079]
EDRIEPVHGDHYRGDFKSCTASSATSARLLGKAETGFELRPYLASKVVRSTTELFPRLKMPASDLNLDPLDYKSDALTN